MADTTAPSGFDPAAMQAYMQLTASLMQGGMPGAPGQPFPAAPYPYTAAPAAQEPMVSVCVEGMKFQYQLTEDDITKVFSRYGAVKSITVDDAGGAATVCFYTMSDAQAAMSDLDGKVLNGLDGTLRLRWVTSSAQAPAHVPPPYPGMPFGWPPQGPAPWMAAAASGAGPPPPGAYGSLPGAGAADYADRSGLPRVDPEMGKGVRKYTCRFIIGIENDKEFQVARRIIGAKGANMKRIVKATDAKLRLRGVGSGYLEGAGQKESQEPLQLCISCTSPDGYRVAVKSVEDILKRTYDEYRTFCQEKGSPPPDLKINLSENQLVYSPGQGDPGLDESRARRRGGKGAVARKAAEVERGEPGPNAPPVDEIEGLIDERNEARRASNFAEADRIRDLLHQKGVALMDEPGGRGKGAEVTTWRYWRD